MQKWQKRTRRKSKRMKSSLKNEKQNDSKYFYLINRYLTFIGMDMDIEMT